MFQRQPNKLCLLSYFFYSIRIRKSQDNTSYHKEKKNWQTETYKIFSLYKPSDDIMTNVYVTKMSSRIISQNYYGCSCVIRIDFVNLENDVFQKLMQTKNRPFHHGVCISKHSWPSGYNILLSDQESLVWMLPWSICQEIKFSMLSAWVGDPNIRWFWKVPQGNTISWLEPYERNCCCASTK